MDRNKLIDYLTEKVDKANERAFAYIPLTIKEVENIIHELIPRKNEGRDYPKNKEDKRHGQTR